eukprot:TRINITY_DN4024_c0_g1_i1.p1 TRINITY_DN4024_c0_g1~~TRINITY_DN4024_c0_g1_i1.p1  ORF type:complete len:254 (-),score=41.28 TRINITY_DN4024_c0_g1_i1:174-935(-)
MPSSTTNQAEAQQSTGFMFLKAKSSPVPKPSKKSAEPMDIKKEVKQKVATATPQALSPPTKEQDFSSSYQNLYKTELCRSFLETGACRYGWKCQFAHGEDELRPISRHPKYKTEICKTFHTIGTCPYGTRCRFIHRENLQRGSAAPPTSPPVSHSVLSTSPVNSLPSPPMSPPYVASPMTSPRSRSNSFTSPLASPCLSPSFSSELAATSPPASFNLGAPDPVEGLLFEMTGLSCAAEVAGQPRLPVFARFAN